MGEDKRDEEQEKSFVVRDKRFSAKKEEKEESQIKEEEKVRRLPERMPLRRRAPFLKLILRVSSFL